jgi:hypothetical protein
MNLKFTSYLSLIAFFLIFALPTPERAEDQFNWQTLESGMLKVHWYEGDANFGQAALDTAQAGLESIGQLIPSNPEQPIEIFIYAHLEDLQGALLSGEEAWVVGHADPELGTVLVWIEPGPGQEIAMGQRIPHELMHVMLYRFVGEGYHNLPAWLREGTATLAETYPNGEYQRVLKDAVAKNALIPLKDLCGSFPANQNEAFLAYAQAGSFAGYLHETFGPAGLQSLARVYADGMDCERGSEHALGHSLASLEAKWRASALGQKALSSTLQNISPYFVLLCLVLILPMLGILSTLRKGSSNEPGAPVRVRK